MKKTLLLSAIVCLSLISFKSFCQDNYSNKASKQKLVTQLKAAIEAMATNLVAYKGDEMKEVNCEEDLSESNVYKSKKAFALASLAVVTCPKEQKNNELYLEFDGFESDEDAQAFGDELAGSLRKLTYTFGTLEGVSTGADGILKLIIKKGKTVPKAFGGLNIYIRIPDGGIDNDFNNKITVHVFR